MANLWEMMASELTVLSCPAHVDRGPVLNIDG
jgi:hypothetical protein